MACILYNALTYDDLVGEYQEVYTSFAAEARRRGYASCIRIHASMSAGDRVGVSEAQYDVANQTKVDGKKFLASFASEAWKSYFKELIELFVRDYGYQYVIFEGCEYCVDIPGSSDPFYARYAEEYPDAKYPTERRENADYFALQQAKATVVQEFFTDIIAHAKQLGAKHIGILPSYFTPSVRTCAGDMFNHSCNSGVLARVPGIDFVMSRMSREDVYNGLMRTGDELQESPELCLIEVLAHTSAKPTIAVDGLGDQAGLKPAPADFANDCTNAALAAAPCGFMGHWYGEGDVGNYGIPAAAAELTGKLGYPKAPVAFVFSYSGTRHSTPYNYETVFQFYEALIKEMIFKEHLPILTFHAETLQQDLIDHPEVQVLVFDEHFPLTAEQMLVIRDWWQGSQKRAAVAFGLGQGFSADVSFPGVQPSAAAYPGMLELIGLKHDEEDLVVRFEQPIALNDVSRVRRSAFLGEDLAPRITAIAGLKRVFGSRANVLYEAEHADTRLPVVVEWRDRSTLAIFCGFGLSRETADMAVKAIAYAMQEMDVPAQIIDSCSEGILWNSNKHDYVILTNMKDNAGAATARPGRANLWDCQARAFLPDGDPIISVEPHSIRVFRVVGRRSKFLDVLGCSCMHSLMNGAGRAEIELLAGKKTVFVLRNSPKEIIVDGRASTITQEVVDGVYYVTLLQCPPGDRKISLKW
ncbi:MAG: hypothetical protein NT018_06075 [Armatimonadetes bacterium]|nr:hypothetical protein [Armatimonadota bacterium]